MHAPIKITDDQTTLTFTTHGRSVTVTGDRHDPRYAPLTVSIGQANQMLTARLADGWRYVTTRDDVLARFATEVRPEPGQVARMWREFLSTLSDLGAITERQACEWIHTPTPRELDRARQI